MSLPQQTIEEISANIIAQMEAELNQTIPLLPKSFNRVLAKSTAAVFVILYKYGGFTFLQMWIRTASAKETEVNGVKLSPLVEWGRQVGVGDPVPATHAELSVEIVVDNETGQLNSGTQMLNANNGVTYLTVGDIVLDGPAISLDGPPTVTGTIRAASDQSGGPGSGVIGNLEAGDVVSFVNPLPNVARDATVLSQVTTGADAEDTEIYRQRVLDRWQKRLQGGAYVDYEAWGDEVAGIVNVYPYTSTNPGQVDIYVEATPESSGDPDGIPTTAQLQAVFDSIELDSNGLASRRPANALHNTYPITRISFDVVVSGLSVDNPAEVQDNISTALEQYFLERAPYIIGLTVPPRMDRVTESGVGGVVDDIVTAAGGIFQTVQLSQSGAPTEVYTLGVGQKAKLGTETFS